MGDQLQNWLQKSWQTQLRCTYVLCVLPTSIKILGSKTALETKCMFVSMYHPRCGAEQLHSAGPVHSGPLIPVEPWAEASCHQLQAFPCSYQRVSQGNQRAWKVFSHFPHRFYHKSNSVVAPGLTQQSGQRAATPLSKNLQQQMLLGRIPETLCNLIPEELNTFSVPKIWFLLG